MRVTAEGQLERCNCIHTRCIWWVDKGKACQVTKLSEFCLVGNMCNLHNPINWTKGESEKFTWKASKCVDSPHTVWRSRFFEIKLLLS